MDSIKDWLKHKASGLVAAAVTAGVTMASKKWNLGLTPDQCLTLGAIVTGGLMAHGAANSHAENSKPDAEGISQPYDGGVK